MTIAANSVEFCCCWFWDRPTLLPLVQSGALDPATVITHIVPLGKATEMYKIFNDKADNCIKVLFCQQYIVSLQKMITNFGPNSP